MRSETIAIVGANELGCKIASLSLRAGYRTILEDISTSALERGTASIAKALENDAAAKKLNPRELSRRLSQLVTANRAEDACREADLIIETVADELEMKLELFTIFDKFAKPGAVFASTTNTLSIDDLAEMTVCPERCIGMRFAWDSKAVQLTLVRGRRTSKDTLARCRQIRQALRGKADFGQSGEAQSRHSAPASL